MNIEQFDLRIKSIQNEINDKATLIGFLTAHKDFLLSIETGFSTYYGIQFQQPSREDTLAIIKHFGGKWDKSYDEDKINYSQYLTDPKLYLAINFAPPPAGCRIETETVIIPSAYVPEHTVTRRKLVCKEPVSPDNSEKPVDPATPPDFQPEHVVDADVLTPPPDYSVLPSVEMPKTEPIQETLLTKESSDLVPGHRDESED